MRYFKRPNGKIYAGDYTKPQEKGDVEISLKEVQTISKARVEKESKSKEREAKIIQTLGAKDKQDAIIKQLNLINESIATGDNTKVKEVDTIVKKILNS